MKAFSKACRGAMLLLLSPSMLLFGQQHNGGSPAGSYSGQNFGMSPIAPFRMPPSIGLSPPSFGKNSANTYPAFLPSTGAYPAGDFAGRGRYPSQRGNGRYASRRNYGGAYPFFAAPYYLPGDSGFYDAAAYSDEPAPVDDQAPQESALGAQVAQLSAQIDDLQNQLGRRNSQAEAPRSEPFETAPAEQQPPSAPVTVVLNDGKSFKVQNYAVMGDTFWDFSSQPVKKIAVSRINVAASAQASEAEGAEFPKITGSGSK